MRCFGRGQLGNGCVRLDRNHISQFDRSGLYGGNDGEVNFVELNWLLFESIKF